MKDLEKKAKGYALKNAIAYDGKAQQGAVISALFHEGLKKEDMKTYGKKISDIVKEVNSMSLEEQQKEFERLKNIVSEREEREGLPELPDVPKTGIITRFRPAPSGYLHIGHLISNMIPSLFVKKYGGKFYIFIDDTNPESTMKEAYKTIKEDCDWVFGNVYEYINSSDRNEIYYSYAKKMIEKEFAYVCTCNSEKFKELVTNMKPCPCRELKARENLSRWKKMLDKKGYKQGEAVLRFKSDINDPNPAMRDFPLARINTHKHPLQGNKYRVWPLMNLSVAVDDMDYKMTHVIRGKEHMDNAERQKLIWKVFGKEKQFPWTFFMGRMKFTDLILSKRKMKFKHLKRRGLIRGNI